MQRNKLGKSSLFFPGVKSIKIKPGSATKKTINQSHSKDKKTKHQSEKKDKKVGIQDDGNQGITQQKGSIDNEQMRLFKSQKLRNMSKIYNSFDFDSRHDKLYYNKGNQSINSIKKYFNLNEPRKKKNIVDAKAKSRNQSQKDLNKSKDTKSKLDSKGKSLLKSEKKHNKVKVDNSNLEDLGDKSQDKEYKYDEFQFQNILKNKPFLKNVN